MTKPRITPLPYTYTKPEGDVSVLNLADIPVDESQVQDRSLVHLGPQAVGGNHQHPRTEWFVGFGDLVLYWLDEDGVRHEEPMNPGGELKLVEVPPYLSHAVKNVSQTMPAILFEYADAKQHSVESVEVV